MQNFMLNPFLASDLRELPPLERKFEFCQFYVVKLSLELATQFLTKI